MFNPGIKLDPRGEHSTLSTITVLWVQLQGLLFKTLPILRVQFTPLQNRLLKWKASYSENWVVLFIVLLVLGWPNVRAKVCVWTEACDWKFAKVPNENDAYLIPNESNVVQAARILSLAIFVRELNCEQVFSGTCSKTCINCRMFSLDHTKN